MYFQGLLAHFFLEVSDIPLSWCPAMYPFTYWILVASKFKNKDRENKKEAGFQKLTQEVIKEAKCLINTDVQAELIWLI